MRKANVFVNNVLAGVLREEENNKYIFDYLENYKGESVSLTMPSSEKHYEFDDFPPFFEGLLPEGVQLEALLRNLKIDQHDYFTQLVQVGKDLVGNVTVEEIL